MQLRDSIRRFVATTFCAADITDDTSLVGCGVVDSTGVLEVVAFLEQTFGVAIDDDEIVAENLDSIARIAALIERKLLLA